MPIKIDNLSYVYDKKAAFRHEALKNVSFEIADGDFFGIVGTTGSGKSTLVTHFNGLIPVQSGCITVDEFNLTEKYDYKKLRARVGMVFQYPEYQLFAQSVYEDVAFGPRNIGVPDDEIEQRVKESVTLVGLDYEEIKERSPFELSGGQMRRVALAGVIAMKPSILVLDEPTAGLDPRGKHDIMQLIKRLHREIKIVVMISHNMDEVSSYCSKIAVLSDGELKGVFTPDELFGEPEKALSYGLELPSATRIAYKLNNCGVNVGNGIFDVDALVREILRAKGVES